MKVQQIGFLNSGYLCRRLIIFSVFLRPLADSEKLPVQRHRNAETLKSPDSEAPPVEKSKKPKKKEKKHREKERDKGKKKEKEKKVVEEKEEKKVIL